MPAPKKYLPHGIKILFEDNALLIVDKPAGLLSVPARYEREENALSLMTRWLKKGQAKSKKELFAVNRLDRETSGILVFAKSLALRERLHEHWEENEKIYRAVVAGTDFPSDAGTIESYLLQDADYRVHALPPDTNPVPANAQYAKTEYRVLSRGNGVSLVEIRLCTGRKNQIRVHFSQIGHPLIGDRMYGLGNRHRLKLHACRFVFTHPVSRERLTVESPCPF
ncbi:MAG: RluA family pseudouridine synthase [Opitutales bacterium]|nr:RluA family pseudouridine synthase [Opitutales bacterium]